MAIRLANPDIIRQLKATNTLDWENFIYNPPHRPLEEVYIYNEGPSAIEVGANYPDKLVSLLPNSSRLFKSEEVVGLSEGIRILYFKAFPGLLASVLVEGIFL